jgi:hypothetical protein
LIRTSTRIMRDLMNAGFCQYSFNASRTPG